MRLNCSSVVVVGQRGGLATFVDFPRVDAVACDIFLASTSITEKTVAPPKKKGLCFFFPWALLLIKSGRITEYRALTAQQDAYDQHRPILGAMIAGQNCQVAGVL